MAEGNVKTAIGRLGAGDRLLEGMRAGAVDQAAAEATRCRVVETAERLYRQFGFGQVAEATDSLTLRLELT